MCQDKKGTLGLVHTTPTAEQRGVCTYKQGQARGPDPISSIRHLCGLRYISVILVRQAQAPGGKNGNVPLAVLHHLSPRPDHGGQ